MKNLTLDSKNTLCNVGNSILKHFEIPTFHDSFQPLDEVLNKTNKKKVCLILFDAFGKCIIDLYKDKIPFIKEHIYTEFRSVYPPTTVAATTSLTTGKYPLETGYLGWTEYFKEYDDEIHVFPSVSKLKKGKIYTPTIQETILKIEPIWDLINKAGKYKASNVASFTFANKDEDEKTSLKKYFKETDRLLKENNFLYSYCTEPDHTMHLEGTKSKKSEEIILFLVDELKKLVENNKDVLFILHADHGMVDIKQFFFKEHEEFLNTLDKDYISIEPRFSSFKVKDKQGFINYYNKYLSEDFILKSKEEIINEHTFGYGTPHPLFNDMLGDYFLIASSKKYMMNDQYADFHFEANHAGVNKEELALYMMIFNS